MRLPGLVALQSRYEMKAFWRDPAALFFTAILPLSFLVLFVSIFGNERLDEPPVETSTYYVPGIVALAVISATFVNFAITLTQQREDRILKRLRGTPLPPWVFIAGRVAAALMVSVGMTVLLIAIGALFYGVEVPGTPLIGFTIALLVGAATFCCLGIAITAAIPTEKAGPPMANGFALPLYFISGLFVPTQEIPEWMRGVADVFPIKPFAESLLTAFDPRTTGTGIAAGDLAVVAAWGVAGMLLAIRFFRWTPRGG